MASPAPSLYIYKRYFLKIVCLRGLVKLKHMDKFRE
jgi:hypothetical protein